MPDQRRINALLETCQTPFYLFDEQAVEQRIGDLRRALPDGVRICYAMKANPFVIECAAGAADLVEVCSPGEFAICQASGIPDEKLVISGVYKERAAMQELVAEHPHIHRYTAESIAQFELLASLGFEEGVAVPVLMRLTSGTQFGMDAQDLKRLVREHRANASVDIRGIQFFSGTQKGSAERVRHELEMLDSLVEELAAEEGFEVREVEYGPGIPVDYCEKDVQTAQSSDRKFLSVLADALAAMRFEGPVALEIGRGIAAACGIYVTSIVDVKRNRGHNYAIADGGRHQMVYYGQSLALKPPACRIFPERKSGEVESWAVCGALCTAGDLLAKQVDVDDLHVGDCVVFPNAGAYCMTEGLALFLSRDLPRVYLANGPGAPRIVRDKVETSVLNTPGSCQP